MINKDSVKSALNIARNIKYEMFPKPDDPIPSAEEALKIISEERRNCWFNWLTGENAENVLRGYLESLPASSSSSVLKRAKLAV